MQTLDEDLPISNRYPWIWWVQLDMPSMQYAGDPSVN